MRFKLITIFVVIAALATFIILGIWQLSRMQEKSKLQALKISNQSQTTVDFDQIKNFKNNWYRTVILNGTWIESELFFLDLRKHKSKTGMQVIMPFLTKAGNKVLVNRGWIEHKPADNNLPKIKSPDSLITISGILTRVEKAKVDFSNSKELGKRRMFIAIDKLKQKDPQLPAVIVLQADNNFADGLKRSWQLPEPKPGMHLGYAIQWFAFALILLIVSIYFIVKKG